MKLAWFTPMSQKSAIARFSVGVAESLSKIVDLDVCYFDDGEPRKAAAPTRRFASADAITDSTLKAYDMVAYNLGNHLPFHREIYRLSQRWPGICVLHDFVMHHFFAAYYLEHLRDPGGYRLLLGRNYSAAADIPPQVWDTPKVSEYPLFEEAIRGALGVVAHSSFLKERVEACFAGPVGRISLAYDAGPVSPALSRAELNLAAGQMLIVTIGQVNPNKQIECVIDAIAQLGPAARSIVYAVVGPVSSEYLVRLKTRIAQKGLGNAVRFLGQVSDELLRAYLASADLCINLRYPVTEGASASAIEEMLSGKPVIVSDSGFFAELPGDCVIKVRPGAEADLTAALRQTLNDEALRRGLGERAKAFAEVEFHADLYAKRFLEFVWEVQSATPILSLADRIGVELCRMGASADLKSVDSISERMWETFVSRPPES